MVEELESEHKDVTEYYLYSYHHDIGKNSSDPELMMVEYLDVVQMFEECRFPLTVQIHDVLVVVASQKAQPRG